MPIEENEISLNANGGTELVKRGLRDRIEQLEPGLLDHFQIIPSRVRELDPTKIRVYWLHDLPDDPENGHLRDPSSREKFHQLVFVSDWQYTRFRDYLGIGYSENHVVIDNAIVPFPRVEKSKDEIRLIYTPTPHRGLGILVPAFEYLSKKYDNLHLDVFSSFNIYGWPDRDKQFEPLFEACRQHPNITYHGFQSNDIVRLALQRAHIFAYPSIWMETSSIAVIEAMSAGCQVVVPNWGALPETTGKICMMYQGDADPAVHGAHFIQTLEHAIINAHKEDTEKYCQFVKAYADTRFNWDFIALRWVQLLKSLLEKYPTEESRAFPKPSFRYSTT